MTAIVTGRPNVVAGALEVVGSLMVLHCAHDGDVLAPSDCLTAFLGEQACLSSLRMLRSPQPKSTLPN